MRLVGYLKSSLGLFKSYGSTKKKYTTSTWVYLLSHTVIFKVIHGSFFADTFQILNKFRYKPFLV